MKKLLEHDSGRPEGRQGSCSKSGDCRRSEELGDPSFLCHPVRCGSRRTVRLDGVRANLAIVTDGALAPWSRCMLLSFQGSGRLQMQPSEQNRISIFAASESSGGSQRGRIARLLRGRLHWMKVEEVESQSVPLSMLVEPLPPSGLGSIAPPKDESRTADREISAGVLTGVRRAEEGEQTGAFRPSGPCRRERRRRGPERTPAHRPG